VANAPAAAPAAAPVAEAPAPAPAASAPKGPALQSRAERNALGRITIYNDGKADWTECQLRLPDQSHYQLGLLAAGNHDGVMSIKFTKNPEPPLDHVVVHCDEGQTRFEFENPRAPGVLKGHVEHAAMGRIIINNDTGSNWNRCDAKLPNGGRYVIGTLEAHDHIRIAQSDFKKEEVPNNHVIVQCKQGESRFSF
jgi:hypothetical protein